jgi:hypothetical protein
MEKAMNTFLHDDNKHVLGICSGYGTGKTTYIKNSIKKYPNEMKRCLFITHRRSLASDIEKNFTDVGFVSYLNKEEFSAHDDKIIVNMDSLKCLYMNKNYFSKHISLQSYDVIILDEFTSLLNNFESSLMGDSRIEIYNIFKRLIVETPKVICCDGDFSNREYQYLTNIIDKSKIDIYQNEFKQEPYHYVFTKNESKFLDDIENNLKNKKNIAVTCMSSKKALEFEKYYLNKKLYNLLIKYIMKPPYFI